jgi:alpha-beta hydrolase superfamily lysophospholipase
MGAARQPIVVLGGFLITREAYAPMLQTLEHLSGQPVELVPVGRLEWLLTVTPWAWARILDRVAAAVRRQAAASATGRVTLVGHSSGGVMLRLFLDDQPFEGRRWNGRALADTLVMLGSPHTALKATPLRRLVQRRLPGCAFAPAVRVGGGGGGSGSGAWRGQRHGAADGTSGLPQQHG